TKMFPSCIQKSGNRLILKLMGALSMFDMHLNSHDTLLKFDQQLPVYNWYYPFPKEENEIFDSTKALEQLPRKKQGQRALYFHIPFCDTLCTFCPFYRSVSYTYHEYIEKYLEAL